MYILDIPYMRRYVENIQEKI